MITFLANSATTDPANWEIANSKIEIDFTVRDQPESSLRIWEWTDKKLNHRGETLQF